MKPVRVRQRDFATPLIGDFLHRLIIDKIGDDGIRRERENDNDSLLRQLKIQYQPVIALPRASPPGP